MWDQVGQYQTSNMKWELGQLHKSEGKQINIHQVRMFLFQSFLRSDVCGTFDIWLFDRFRFMQKNTSLQPNHSRRLTSIIGIFQFLDDACEGQHAPNIVVSSQNNWIYNKNKQQTSANKNWNYKYYFQFKHIIKHA